MPWLSLLLCGYRTAIISLRFLLRRKTVSKQCVRRSSSTWARCCQLSLHQPAPVFSLGHTMVILRARARPSSGSDVWSIKGNITWARLNGLHTCSMHSSLCLYKKKAVRNYTFCPIRGRAYRKLGQRYSLASVRYIWIWLRKKTTRRKDTLGKRNTSDDMCCLASIRKCVLCSYQC